MTNLEIATKLKAEYDKTLKRAVHKSVPYNLRSPDAYEKFLRASKEFQKLRELHRKIRVLGYEICLLDGSLFKQPKETENDTI